MEAKQAKVILQKKYPTGKVSPAYFFYEGKYYTGVIFGLFENVPKDLKAFPLDRGLATVSVDANTGEIESYESSLDILNIFKKGQCEFVDW